MSSTPTEVLAATAASRLPERTRLLDLVPGVLLLAAVGFAGKWTEQFINRYGKAHHLTLPNIEYVLWAILFGVLIANTVGLPRLFRAGVATYEFWLKAGIILLGARFILGDIAKLGGISLGLVAVELLLALSFMTWLGRRFHLSPKLTTLLAVGSSVCGVSAIIATQGTIDADEGDTSTAIAAILALGAISLFAFPLIGHALGMSDHAYGLWTGLAVDNTAEATAAGALYSDAAGKFAVLAKNLPQRHHRLRRPRLRHPVGPQRPRQPHHRVPARPQGRLSLVEVPQVRPRLPLHLAPRHPWRQPQPLGRRPRLHQTQLTVLGNLSRWAFLLTFAGVGLRTNLRDLGKQGARPFLVSALGEIAIAAITLGLVLGADRLYHL